MRFVELAIFGAVVTLLSSCSTIITGTTQNVTITSNVSGATVMVNGNMVGKTPLTARVKREDKMHYIVQKEGYDTYQATMATKLDPWFFGNIIIGGVLGSTTDFALGSTNKIDPDNIYVELTPLATKSSGEEKPEPATPAPTKKKASKEAAKTAPPKASEKAAPAPETEEKKAE